MELEPVPRIGVQKGAEGIHPGKKDRLKGDSARVLWYFVFRMERSLSDAHIATLGWYELHPVLEARRRPLGPGSRVALRPRTDPRSYRSTSTGLCVKTRTSRGRSSRS